MNSIVGCGCGLSCSIHRVVQEMVLVRIILFALQWTPSPEPISSYLDQDTMSEFDDVDDDEYGCWKIYLVVFKYKLATPWMWVMKIFAQGIFLLVDWATTQAIIHTKARRLKTAQQHWIMSNIDLTVSKQYEITGWKFINSTRTVLWISIIFIFDNRWPTPNIALDCIDLFTNCAVVVPLSDKHAEDSTDAWYTAINERRRKLH